MAQGRHSYVSFYPSDWIAGTARMGAMQRLVYMEICIHNWDRAEPCPAAQLPLMFHDVGDWKVTVEALVAAGKLMSDDRGYWSERALAEAEKRRKSRKGGR